MNTTVPLSQQSEAAAVSTRDPGLNVVRVVASMLVVLLHVAALGFYTFGPHWWAYNSFDSASRMAVPLFFMLTGSLLIPRTMSIADTLKRTAKIAFILVFWSFLYLLFDHVKYAIPVEKISLQTIILYPVKSHLWYFYSLIGLYLFIPVLSALYRNSGNEQISYYLLVAFAATSLVPTASALIGYSITSIDTRFFMIYAAYAMLGAALSGLSLRLSTISILLLGSLLFGAVTAVLTWHISVLAKHPIETLYEYTSPIVALSAALAFPALRGVGPHLTHPVARRLFGVMSTWTLGIYILHIAILDLLLTAGYRPDIINPWIGIPVLTAVVWSMSAAAAAAIRALPFGRFVLP